MKILRIAIILISIAVVSTRAAAGVLYVGTGAPSQSNGTVYAMDSNGQNVLTTGIKGAFGLAFDPSKRLYVSDTGQDKIYRINPNGSRTEYATVGNSPEGISFDPSGNLYAACSGGKIYKVTPGGLVSVFKDLLAAYSNSGLTTDSFGNIYAANYGSGGTSGSYYKFSPTGIILAQVSGVSGGDGIAVEGSGNVYLSEFGLGGSTSTCQMVRGRHSR